MHLQSFNWVNRVIARGWIQRAAEETLHYVSALHSHNDFAHLSPFLILLNFPETIISLLV